MTERSGTHPSVGDDRSGLWLLAVTVIKVTSLDAIAG